MKMSYKGWNSSQTGKGSSAPPPFYEELHELLER
jgi:hypothetical protein